MPDSAFDLTGRTAVITGASYGGIGYHSALAIARAGASVVVSDHPSACDELDKTVIDLTAEGYSATGITADVSDESSVIKLIDDALSQLGQVDILANLAGAMLRGPTVDTSLSDWHRVIDINLTGTFLLNRAVAPGMIARGSGKIINTSSVYAQIVGPIPEPAYYASKAGVANLTRGFAAEWGPHGINVNCLAPGVFYPTRMTAALNGDNLSGMTERTLLKRLGDPTRDIGGTLVWLSSGAADYVTGQVIFVDGGWSSN